MENQRDTITIETPADKHSVILNAYITGREKRNLNNIFQAWQVGLGDKGMISDKKDTKGMIENAENEAIKTVVVSVDGISENVLDKVLDMKSDDYVFVIKKINEITSGSGFLAEAQTEIAK